MRGTLVTRTLTNAEPTDQVDTQPARRILVPFPERRLLEHRPWCAAIGRDVTEAQIYRNSDLLTWGPIVQLTGTGSEGEVTCDGAGVDWYLNRRFIDGRSRTMLTNPDFESGPRGWTTNGSHRHQQHDPISSRVEVGQARRTRDGGTVHFASVRDEPNGIGCSIVLSGWFTSSRSPACRRLTAPASTSKAYRSRSGAYRTTTRSTRQRRATMDQSRRSHLWVPPNESWQFNVKALRAGGTIYYDDMKAVVDVFDVDTGERRAGT
jgi:hypothetical protein